MPISIGVGYFLFFISIECWWKTNFFLFQSDFVFLVCQSFVFYCSILHCNFKKRDSSACYERVDKSYGIHVARLAGMPEELTNRAGEILAYYENKEKTKQTTDSSIQLSKNTNCIF